MADERTIQMAAGDTSVGSTPGCENGQVTYRWRDSETKKMATRTVSGAAFLWLLMQHVFAQGLSQGA